MAILSHIDHSGGPTNVFIFILTDKRSLMTSSNFFIAGSSLRQSLECRAIDIESGYSFHLNTIMTINSSRFSEMVI